MTRATTTVLAILAIVLLPSRAAAQPQPEMEPGQVIVHWKSSASSRELRQIGKRRVLASRAVTPRSWVYHLDERSLAATREAIAELQHHPDVAVVEPNLIRRPFMQPNDTLYVLQWYTKTVNLEAAWDKTTGSSKVVVAVVDTGILADHPDLAGRILPGYDFITDVTNAGDGNGWDADATDAGDETTPSSGLHGTHVAGIIGATANNSRGIAGVNWTSKVLPVRALGINAGKGTDADIGAAIRWAAGLPVTGAPQNPNPARVINLSFGGTGLTSMLSDAVADAQKAGCVVVAAAGNQSMDAGTIYPGALPGVIAVGAITYKGARASYSNYGSTVALMAPGGDLNDLLPFPYDGKSWPAGILSTLRVQGLWDYRLYEGTSQASPIVAGVASLLLSVNPSLTVTEVSQILTSTANPSGKCAEGCGAGLLDAGAAVAKAMPAAPPPTTSKLAFGESCSTDDQCADGGCHNISEDARICTRSCSDASTCPQGADCQNGLCVPGGSLPQSGASCGSGSTSCANPDSAAWTGGCALGGRGLPASGAAGGLLLLVALLAARRRRR